MRRIIYLHSEVNLYRFVGDFRSDKTDNVFLYVGQIVKLTAALASWGLIPFLFRPNCGRVDAVRHINVSLTRPHIEGIIASGIFCLFPLGYPIQTSCKGLRKGNRKYTTFVDSDF